MERNGIKGFDKRNLSLEEYNLYKTLGIDPVRFYGDKEEAEQYRPDPNLTLPSGTTKVGNSTITFKEGYPHTNKAVSRNSLRDYTDYGSWHVVDPDNGYDFTVRSGRLRDGGSRTIDLHGKYPNEWNQYTGIIRYNGFDGGLEDYDSATNNRNALNNIFKAYNLQFEKNGGSLKRIPFYLLGTIKDGIKTNSQNKYTIEDINDYLSWRANDKPLTNFERFLTFRLGLPEKLVTSKFTLPELPSFYNTFSTFIKLQHLLGLQQKYKNPENRIKVIGHGNITKHQQGTNKFGIRPQSKVINQQLLDSTLWKNIDNYILSKEGFERQNERRRRLFGLGPDYDKLIKIRESELRYKNPELANKIDSLFNKYQIK